MIEECDICGRETNVNRYLIEGAEVVACASCGRHGKLIEEPHRGSVKNSTYKGSYPPLNTSKGFTPKPKMSKQSRYSNQKGEKVLIEHYGRVITSATRQELAKSLFIRETLLTKIEAENIRASDEIIKKIEKALNIVLFEESTEAVTEFSNQNPPAKSMTLGDFATIRKKKD